MNELIKLLNKRLGVLVFLIIFLLIVASGSNNNSIIINNSNNVKSIEAVHIVNKYNSLVDAAKPVLVNNVSDALALAKSKSVAFYGSMTAYGPDCAGCSGRTGCPPRQDLNNGNIYFNDNDYGQLRIVAASSNIPCGTIVKISNLSISNDPIYAVVLDRGSAVAGSKMDLLYPTEKAAFGFGSQSNVYFEILRWGW